MRRRQRLVYCDGSLRAPAALASAVHTPDPSTVEAHLAADPRLAWADHLLLGACRVPGYDGHGSRVAEDDKDEAARCAIVRAFVRHGADPSMRNIRKVSPLHMACRFDLPDVARTLIELGAEVDVWEVTRQTPLYRAANLGYARCVAVLLAAGADVMARDREGRVPADLCRNRKIAALLERAGDTERAGDGPN